MINVKGEPADGVAGDDHYEHFDHLRQNVHIIDRNLLFQIN